MVNTDKEYFESKTDYVAVTNANLVYTGSVSFVANDWTTITLTGDGFDYEGGNLVIVVDDNTGSDPGSTNWSSFTATSNQGLYFYQDGSNINPASPSASNNAVTTSKNQIQIGIVPSNTPKPKNLTVSNISSSGTTLAWDAPANATPTGYEYQCKTSTDGWPTDWNSNGTNLTVTLSELTASTDYNFRVRANYAEGDSDPIELENGFRTLDACAVPTNLAATLVSGNGSVATFSWTKGFADDDDWELQYGTDATFANCTTVTDGFTVDGNTVTFNATNGITAEQLHYARVRTDCGGTYSSYTDAVDFTPTNYVDFNFQENATSTSNYYIPFNGSNTTSATNQSQFVIPASELVDMAGGTIRRITYYTASTVTTNWGGVKFDVYMAEMENTTFASATFIDWTTLTNVFTGTVSLSNQKMVIDFNNNYTYNGGNLLIGFKTNTAGTATQSIAWTALYGSTYQAVYQYGTGNAIQSVYQPRMTFNYLPTAYPRITTLAEGTITQTTAQLTWTAPSANVTGYAYQYKLSDGTWPETWENLAANATSVTLEGLTKASNYDFRIKALYGEHESVASTFSFATACDLAELPWTENFNNWTAGILAHPCWVNERIVDGTGSGTLSVFQVENNTLKLPDMPNGTRTKLVLPDMMIPTGASYRFVISVNRNASGTTHPQEGVRVFASQNGEIEGAEELGFLYRNCSQTDGGVVTAETTTGWYTYEFAIPFDGPCNIILRGESTYGSATYMDDLKVSEIPHCAKPSALTFQSSTNNSASFTWTDGEDDLTAWQIAYKLNSDFDPYTDECTIANVTSKPGTISGLQASSHYYAYIRSNCGDGTYSDWSDAYCEFDTQCETIATLDDNFDSHTGVSGGSTNNLPTCWNYINTSSNNSYKGYPVIYSASNYSYSGTNHLRFCSYYYSGAADQYAILPEMDEVNGKRVEFWARYYNSNNNLIVGVMTDPADASTFTALTDGTITDLTTTYKKYRFNISEARGKFIALKMPAATSSTMYVLVDDLKVKPIPDCDDVNNPTCTAFTAHTATLDWTLLDENQDQWQVAYKAGADFDPTDAEALATATIVDVTNPRTINDLSANTTYYAYVRAKCGDNSFGEWSDGYASFTTSIGNPAPTEFVTTDIQTYQVSLDWINGGGDYETAWVILLNSENIDNINTLTDTELGTLVATTGQFHNADSHPTDIDGLTPSTTYYAWVRANCGTDGYSDWVALNHEGNGYFTTVATCPAPANLAVTENSETIEGATITWNGTNDSFVVERGSFDQTGTPVAVTVLEEGFENNGTSLPTGWTCSGNAWSVGTNYYSTVHTGTSCAKISIDSYDSESYLITPEMDLSSLASATINLWYTNIAWGSDIDEFGVYYRVNGGAWNELFYTTNAHDTWTEMGETTLPNLAANYQIGFYIYSNWGHGVAIDDITISGMQYPIAWAQDGTAANNENTGTYIFTGLDDNTTYFARVKGVCTGEGESEYSEVVNFTTLDACPAPTDFNLLSVSANSASFSWDGGIATVWRVWVKKSSETDYPTTYTTVQTTSSTIIEDLEATETYDVKIAPECDLTKYLEVEGAFTTPCVAVTTFPWKEDFNDLTVQNSIPSCWNNDEGTTTTDNYKWCYNTQTSGNGATNGTSHDGTNCVRFNSYNNSSGNTNFLKTQALSLPANVDNIELSFWFKNPTGGDFSVYLSTDGGLTHNTEIATGLVGQSTWIQKTYDLKNYKGEENVVIVFKGTSNYGSGDAFIYLDDVEVKAYSEFTKTINAHATGDEIAGWYLIASPLNEAVSVDNVGQMKDNEFDLYRFNQAPTTDEHKEWENYLVHGFDLEPGRGYLYANSADVTLTFTGMPYSGDGTFSLELSDSNPDENMHGWNLVGNPFNANAIVDKDSYYEMNEDGSDIVVATSSSVIEPMEGIFVQATEEGQTVTFTPVTQNAAANNSASLAMNLTQNRGGVIDRAIIRFGGNGTLPKFQLNSNGTKVYIPQDNKDYAVVSAEDQGEMPVSFRAAENGTYTLSFSSENVSFSYLHLIDNMTGADVDLLAATSTGSVATYTFNARTTDYSSRFRLVFATGSNNDSDNFAFFSNGNWIIGNEGEATLQVIDVTGRVLSSETVNGSVSKAINASAGVYMLRLINGNDVKTQKIVVR